MDEQRHPRRALAAVAVVIVALAAAGCGSSSDDTAAGAAAETPAAPKTVDDAQVEQGIKDDLSTSSAKVTKASCPGDVQVEKGATFTCSVTFANGATGKAKVTQLGANKYTYELKPGSVQIPGATAEASIKQDLAAQGAPNATVNCPDNIIVKVDTTVTCDVSGAQGAASGTVTFTFSDEEGTIDSSSVETS
jgi:hypothetical protein